VNSIPPSSQPFHLQSHFTSMVFTWRGSLQRYINLRVGTQIEIHKTESHEESGPNKEEGGEYGIYSCYLGGVSLLGLFWLSDEDGRT
jgi:hypothetical protein